VSNRRASRMYNWHIVVQQIPWNLILCAYSLFTLPWWWFAWKCVGVGAFFQGFQAVFLKEWGLKSLENPWELSWNPWKSLRIELESLRNPWKILENWAGILENPWKMLEKSLRIELAKSLKNPWENPNLPYFLEKDFPRIFQGFFKDFQGFSRK